MSAFGSHRHSFPKVGFGQRGGGCPLETRRRCSAQPRGIDKAALLMGKSAGKFVIFRCNRENILLISWKPGKIYTVWVALAPLLLRKFVALFQIRRGYL